MAAVLDLADECPAEVEVLEEKTNAGFSLLGSCSTDLITYDPDLE